jgi:uncharacterized protein (DUF58 family)
VLFSLAAGTVFTFAMALVFRGAALVAFLVAFALLFGYVASLIRVQRRVRERAKVRYLVTRQSEPEPAMLLRRSASN